ncbi:hypothetical protein J6590_012793 [Homalodisca vitripennis]|nr:hypothetical protein J6590_012793 [Homalodisca vitripennis]
MTGYHEKSSPCLPPHYQPAEVLKCHYVWVDTLSEHLIKVNNLKNTVTWQRTWTYNSGKYRIEREYRKAQCTRAKMPHTTQALETLRTKWGREGMLL